MNLILNILNFLGVCLLVGLCALQWRRDGELARANARLTEVNATQTAKLAEQNATIKSTASDLDDTRQKLTASGAAVKDALAKLQLMTRQHDQCEAQREQLTKDNAQLHTQIESWTKALADRDEALKRAGEQVQRSQAERNDAVLKFNDQVAKYNDVVKQLQAARSH